MKKNIPLTLIALLLFSCSNEERDEDCTKSIEINQFYLVNNNSYNYSVSQEVPCDFDEQSEIPEQIEPVLFQNLSYNILEFEHIINIEEGFERLSFEIELINPTSNTIKGFTEVILSSDNGTSQLYFYGCETIGPNSNCIFKYEAEGAIIVENPSEIQIVDLKYYLTN